MYSDDLCLGEFVLVLDSVVEDCSSQLKLEKEGNTD